MDCTLLSGVRKHIVLVGSMLSRLLGSLARLEIRLLGWYTGRDLVFHGPVCIEASPFRPPARSAVPVRFGSAKSETTGSVMPAITAGNLTSPVVRRPKARSSRGQGSSSATAGATQRTWLIGFAWTWNRVDTRCGAIPARFGQIDPWRWILGREDGRSAFLKTHLDHGRFSERLAGSPQL